MHIYIPNQSKQTLGGGFIFIDNLKKGAAGRAKFVGRWEDAHAVFICSATMTDRGEIQRAKAAGKKIIFRVDNMPKDSRNRGTAFSRMRDYGRMADVVVFQSRWARAYVGGWLAACCGVDLSGSSVIYNGVDTDFFHHRDDPAARGETYLFITYNTDPNKRFQEAAYDFHLRTMDAVRAGRPKPKLRLVGNFDRGVAEYGFDFFAGEDFAYEPPVAERGRVGDIYRGCRYLYFPAFADASPNTVGEAMACGCEPLLVNPVGGTAEVVEQYRSRPITVRDMADRYLALVR